MSRVNVKAVFVLAVSAALGLGPLSVIPAQADETQNQIQNQVETQTQTETQNVYGWQMMTPGERESYMAQMRNAETQEERDQIRAAHHYEMQERARERGVTLPDMPMGPGAGQGMGQGQGMAPGMGQGMDPNMRKGMGGGSR